MSAVGKLSCKFLLLISFLTLGLVDSLQAAPIQPRIGSPIDVLYFERLLNVLHRVTGAQQASAPEHHEISFTALGKQFELHLEPNDLFAPKAKNIWVGDATTETGAPTVTFYKGEVKGQPGSWVRVSMQNGVMNGMIRTPEDVYFVEPGARFLPHPSLKDMVIYRLSDTVPNWQFGSCALDDPTVAAVLGRHAPPAPASSGNSGEYEALKQELQALAGSTLEQIDIGLVADYEYFLEHGAAAAADLQNIINQIDGIYRAELGVTLRITQTVVYTTASDPFSSTTDSYTLLQEFSNYKANPSSPVYGTGLAHLFTNRDLSGSTIGIAWLGTVCQSQYASGVSQDFTTSNKSLVLLTAHEVGHNFNAPHDNQSGSPCAATPFGFIMNPFLDPTLNLQFSECSKAQIAPEVAGASCMTTVAGDPTSCTYTISPTSSSPGAAASTGSVNVITGNDCAWTAASNSSWLTITDGASGSGNGTVTYSVAANTGSSSRSGTLTIAGQTFTVTQAGTPSCTYAISPTSRSLAAAAASGSVSVTTTTGCSWTAGSNAPWLTITAGANGTGNGTVAYSVAANTGTSARTGTLTIAGKTFTLTQAGATSCTYTISPTSRLHTAAAATGSVTVSTSSTCSWTAVSNAPWLTITAGASRTGSGTVSYSVAVNTGSSSRTGTLTIAGKTFTVTQAGSSSCTFTISPTSRSHTRNAETGSVSITTASGCSWTAVSNTAWITLTAGASGTGNGTVTYSITGNPGFFGRTGTLTIAGKTFTVSQRGAF